MFFRLVIGIFLIAIAFQKPDVVKVDTVVIKPKPVVVVPKPEPAPAPKPEPKPQPKPVVVETFKTINITVKNNRYRGDSLFDKIMSRHATGYTGDGRTTNAHETVHFINSDIRNWEVRQGNSKATGFFISPDRGFVTREPRFRKSQINRFVPASLRFSRFNLYLVQQVEWDDRPLYIFDEWVAYIAGGQVGVDDHKRGVPKDNTVDVVEGCIEFSVYSVATCMAIKEYDPELWADAEFKAFVKHMLKTSEATFNEGRTVWPWKRQEDILTNLRTSPDAQAMRDFIKENFDGVFLQ
jgi:hypothetical protein